jgi:transcription initiation factor TFIIE subunit alpha
VSFHFRLLFPSLTILLAPVYDQYYASLAASSAASAHSTPTAIGVPSSSSNSPDFLNSHLNDDDEEDKKPNVEYLDSLNAYRKRSRSQEDVGSADKIKLAKMDSSGDLGTTNGHVNGFLRVNGFGHHGNGEGFAAEPQDGGMRLQELDDMGLTAPEDDPMILGWSFPYFLFPSSAGCIRYANHRIRTVNGVTKPYSQVTEDDHDLMTPDEYTAFFEVMQTRS